LKDRAMSKFRTRLRDIGRPSAGFGFAAVAQRERPRHVLVLASVASVDEASTAAEAGADAVVLSGGPSAVREVAARVQVPIGVYIADATRDQVAETHEAGADFFLFEDARTHASALTHEEIGKVLVLGPDQQEERLRAVAAIDLDALLVELSPTATTVRDQIELRRVSTLTGATVLAQCRERPDAAALEAWRDAGAPAVLVPAGVLAETIEAASKVPARRRPRHTGDVPMLGAPPAHDDHDHDHEDDD
jgi:hypothetical protein